MWTEECYLGICCQNFVVCWLREEVVKPTLYEH